MNTDNNIGNIVRATVTGVKQAAPVTPRDRQTAPEQTVATQPKKEPARAYSREDVEKVAAEVQTHLKRLNTELRIEVDTKDHEVVVKIVDPETKDVIRQVPSEELMAIRERMKELIGILYDART